MLKHKQFSKAKEIELVMTKMLSSDFSPLLLITWIIKHTGNIFTTDKNPFMHKRGLIIFPVIIL